MNSIHEKIHDFQNIDPRDIYMLIHDAYVILAIRMQQQHQR